MSRSALAQLLILVSLVAGLSAQRDPGTPQLIKDLDTRPLPPVSSWPAGFAADGAVLWFAADDGVHGTELFRSLGTPQSTLLVADLYPGAGGSRPTQITPFAGRVFFLADDGTHGLEPHCSDGTSGGTTRLGDFAPGATSSWVPRAFAFGTSIVFSIDDGTHGLEPWISDGTASGTRLLLDVVPGRGGSSWWGHVARELNGQPCIEFVALNGGSVELWRSDGTGAGTRLVAPLSGTQMVSRIGILPDGRSALWTGRAGNALQTLWVSDGTTANTVALTTLVANFAPTYPAEFDGRLFFAAYAPNIAVATDGTAGETRFITPGVPRPSPVHRFVGVMGGDLWGIPDSSYSGVVFELIRIRSGQSTAERVAVSAGVGDRFPTDLPPISVARNRFVFWSTWGDLVGFDPAGSTTVTLAPAATHQNATQIGAGGRVWFQLNDPTAGSELGVTDGTPGGTRLALNIARDDGRPNYLSTTSRYAATARGAMFLTTNPVGYTVWRTDGTPQGTLPALTLSGESITQFGAGDIDYVAERMLMLDRLFASRRGQPFSEIALPPGTSAFRQFGRWRPFRDSLFLEVYSSFSPSGLLSVDATGASAWVTTNETRLAARLGERLLLASIPTMVPRLNGTRVTVGLLSSDGTAQGTHGLAKVEQNWTATNLPAAVFRDRAWFLALDQDATEQLASIDGSSGAVTMHGSLRPSVSDNGVLAIAALEDTIVLLDQTNAWFCDGRSPPRPVVLRNQSLRGTTSIVPLGARALIEVNDQSTHSVLGIDPTLGTAWTIPLPSSRVDKPLVIGRDRALLRVNVGGSAGPARYETWITDGTAAGTRRSTLPELFSTPVISRGRIFAAAFDPVANVEPHVSDAGATVTRLEEGCGGTRSPTLDALADPILGSTMPVRGQSRAGAVAFLMLSVAPLSPPPLLGGTPCRFHVDPAAFTIQGSYPLVNGEFRTSLPIPADPAFRGFEVVLQFVAGPSDATLGADLSNGLLLRLGS